MNKNRLFIIVPALLVLGGPIVHAVQNPSVRNPAGYTTVPQSYLRSSLVDTSSPIDNSGNQIVTGNVRRGARFQADVPYSSPSSFNSTLGSSTLSSFMRDSAGAEDIGSYRGTAAGSTSGTSYQPYYLPSSTVTTMSPNNSGLTTQLNTSVNNGSQYVAGSRMQQSQELPAENQPTNYTQGASNEIPTLWQLYNSGMAGAQSQYNPSAVSSGPNRTPSELQPIHRRSSLATLRSTSVSRDSSDETRATNNDQSPDPTNGSHFTQTGQNGIPGQWQQTTTVSRYGTSQAEGTPGTLEQKLAVINNNTLRPYTFSQPAGVQQYQEQNTPQDTKTSEAIAQIQKQLDDLIRSIDSRLKNPTDYTSQYSTTVQDVTVPEQTDTSYQPGISSQDFSGRSNNRRLQELMGTYDNSETQRLTLNGDETRDVKRNTYDVTSRVNEQRNTDFESFSQSKYNQLFRAAEGHLSLGRFHQAADAYTLAAIYNPDDPLCYAGRGHALLAAGEYVNSALLLIRAIEIDPEYVNTQIDLAELVGGVEDLNKKITELNKWLQKSNAPGLGFLLSYVYYRQGRFREAGKVMEIVSREMPQSRATIALKMAIDFKLQTQK